MKVDSLRGRMQPLPRGFERLDAIAIKALWAQEERPVGKLFHLTRQAAYFGAYRVLEAG